MTPGNSGLGPLVLEQAQHWPLGSNRSKFVDKCAAPEARKAYSGIGSRQAATEDVAGAFRGSRGHRKLTLDGDHVAG